MRPFSGFKDHRIDGKERVVIPASVAEAIRTESEGRMYLVPHATDPCVEAYPAAIYDRKSDSHDPDRFQGDGLSHRLFFHLAEEVELKGPGRITLPKRFLPLFPKGMVRVCGMKSYLELWDPDAWEKHVGSSFTCARRSARAAGTDPRMSGDARDLSQIHRPVLVREVLEHLLAAPAISSATRPATPSAPLRVDGTVGLGGHAERILEADPTGRVLGLDRDPEALALARSRLARFGDRVRLVHGSYADLEATLVKLGEAAPTGVLLDLGTSSMQIDDPRRGFSFRAEDEAPDMRFDRTGDEPSALDLVNTLDEETLAGLLKEHGDEPRARAVARSLLRARPIRTSGDSAKAIRRAAFRSARIDPATRAFQALRIAVNREMEHLERGLAAALRATAPGGRIVAISFHSGEDRRVKEAWRAAAREGRVRVLTKKPVRPTEDEVRSNPRARPARLRAVEVLGVLARGREVGSGR